MNRLFVPPDRSADAGRTRLPSCNRLHAYAQTCIALCPAAALTPEQKRAATYLKHQLNARVAVIIQRRCQLQLQLVQGAGKTGRSDASCSAVAQELSDTFDMEQVRRSTASGIVRRLRFVGG